MVGVLPSGESPGAGMCSRICGSGELDGAMAGSLSALGRTCSPPAPCLPDQIGLEVKSKNRR